MKSKHNDLRIELGYLRDNLIEGIQQGKTALISESLEIYEELIIEFVENLKTWGALYDRNRALQELSSFVEGWDEIEWIQDDIREILMSSVQSTSIEVIRLVSRFPLSLAQHAYREKDYYVFYRFINWIPFYYTLSCDIQEEKTHALIVDRVWRGLAEFERYYLRSDFERAEDEAGFAQSKEYGLGLVQAFNSLLLTSYKKSRHDDFSVFIEAFKGLFQFDQHDVREYQIENLQWQLQRETDEGLKVQLEGNIKLKRAKLVAAKELQESKRLALYGINAWILHHFDIGKIFADEYLKWHKRISAFGSTSESWALFLKAIARETERDFHWHWWELDEHQVPGRIMTEATWIQFDSFLQKLCCICCLEQLKQVPVEQRGSVTLSMSKDQIYLADGDSSPLVTLLSQMQTDAAKWTQILGEEGLQSIPAFIEALKRAVSLRQQENVQLLIQAQLSEDRITQIKRGVLKGWRESTFSRNIVKEYGSYEYINSSPGDGIRFLGFNQLDRKDVYVEDSGVLAAGWGEHYGQGLADGEDKTLFDTLYTSLPPLENGVVAEGMIREKVDDALIKLQQRGYSPIIMVLNSWAAGRSLESGDFISPDKLDANSRFKGYYKNRPLFSLFHRQKSSIIVVDLKKLGTWRQYRPTKTYEEETFLTDELSFLAKSYSLESARKLLSEAPGFRTDKTTGAERTEEEALAYIQQHVHLRIIEQFKFDLLDSEAGYIVRVSDLP